MFWSFVGSGGMVLVVIPGLFSIEKVIGGVLCLEGFFRRQLVEGCVGKVGVNVF